QIGRRMTQLTIKWLMAGILLAAGHTALAAEPPPEPAQFPAGFHAGERTVALLEQMLDVPPATNDAALRQRLLSELARCRRRSSVERITQALHSDDTTVRAAAAQAIGELPHLLAGHAIQVALNDEHPRVAAQAIRSAVRLG